MKQALGHFSGSAKESVSVSVSDIFAGLARFTLQKKRQHAKSKRAVVNRAYQQ